MGGTHQRVLGAICTFFAYCDNIYPPPQVLRGGSGPTNESLIVETSTGLLDGFYMSTILGQKIGAYEGIPFAEPPIGDLRFRVRFKVRRGLLPRLTAMYM